MGIIEALLGEHGAMMPLLDGIEEHAATAGLAELHVRANCLRSTLISHAHLEEELLRPAILAVTPSNVQRSSGPTDHEVIEAGLGRVLECCDADAARWILLDTVSKIRTHFTKEENVIFPKALIDLSQECQEELGARWARRRGVRVPRINAAVCA